MANSEATAVMIKTTARNAHAWVGEPDQFVPSLCCDDLVSAKADLRVLKYRCRGGLNGLFRTCSASARCNARSRYTDQECPS